MCYPVINYALMNRNAKIVFIHFSSKVECRQEGERIDDYSCKITDRPDDEQSCYTGIACQAKFYNC